MTRLSQYDAITSRYDRDMIVTSAMDASVPLISAKVPEKLLLLACRLVVSVATTVRPVFLVTIPAVRNVFNLVIDSSSRRLPPEGQVLVCRALSSMLLLPWPNLPESEQQWNTRSTDHAGLLAALTRHYRQLRGATNMQQHPVDSEDVRAELRQTLRILWDIVDSVSGESTKSRQICYQSLQESVQVSLSLFPMFIHQSDVTDDMLGSFLTLFQGLWVQMGVPFTEQIIQTFLNMFTSHEMLQDEIALAVYNMASVDFDAFYSTFLPEFINACQGIDSNQRGVLGRNFKTERDLPSFTQSVHRLANDLHYYRLCNGSLPPGTVKLAALLRN